MKSANLAVRMVSIALLLMSAIECGAPERQSEELPRYVAENGFIVGHNMDRYNNRPLYVNNTNAFVLTGDKPLVRLARGEIFLGTFMAGVIRNGTARWFQEFGSITSLYRSGCMTWKLSDPALNDLEVELDALPVAGVTGLAVRLRVDGAQEGDQLVWAYGGGQDFRKGEQRDLNWYYDALLRHDLLTWGFTPEECRHTTVKAEEGRFIVTITDSTGNFPSVAGVAGHCSARSMISVGDASAWKDLSQFVLSQPDTCPVVKGTASLEDGKDVYWSIELLTDSLLAAKGTGNPEKAFADGVGRVNRFLERLKIHTPDSCLNAVAVSVAAALDGRWYPPRFVHGPMAWNIPYVGWRTTFGPIMLGWHDRVQTEAAYYIGHQVTRSNKKQAKADARYLLTVQDTNSRFNGAGSIQLDQDVHTYDGNVYNMQTQFFDQMIEEWRFTADPELEKLLRPALELQLQWAQDCFDPDGDGLYESYINSWPTDCQWYNGGGTAEETAYAYRAHTAARDMARRVNDQDAVARHEQMLERIKQGFFSKLWVRPLGHSGAYREQGGHERVHKDPWLYSIFLPIDAQLTSPLQALESLYYTEWALQNDRMPLGGRMVWTSNWVPSQWSVRERYQGDNCALALSYFQAGLPDDGWDIMRGSFMGSAFGDVVPGNLGTPVAGADFGDCVDMFTRALVQGMFGYNPDYPGGSVRVSPQFPSGWDHASLELPDVKVAFGSSEESTMLAVQLARSARLELSIPVATERIKGILVDGKPFHDWNLLPGPGCSNVHMWLPQTNGATVNIETGVRFPRHAPVALEGNVGDTVELSATDARIVGFEDPQGVLDSLTYVEGNIRAKLRNNKGYHTVVAKVLAGSAPQWRVFRIRVNDPAGDAKEKEQFITTPPANPSWMMVDMVPQYNADVRAIYRQKYLTPRPNTVSVRLGVDGYSPWCNPFWRLMKPPDVTLDSVKSEDGKLVTPQHVPFLWSGKERNIAFTSMWDNFPRKVSIPVNKKGAAIWFLVAGSTNPMQCQIANAVIRMHYADGVVDSLKLVPPFNYWAMCPLNNIDYTRDRDTFCLPRELPQTVQLGQNCRAMLLNRKLRNDARLETVVLETLSQEVVVGLMGVTVMQ